APRPRAVVKLDPKELDSYVGRYEFEPDDIFPTGVSFSIQRQGERLVGETSKPQAGWGVFDIYPESETNFFLTIVGTRLVFTKDAQGEVTSVVRRIEGWPDCPAKRFTILKKSGETQKQ